MAMFDGHLLASGGGGQSGKVGYADYLEATHSHLLFGHTAAGYSTAPSMAITDDRNAMAYLNVALSSNNPFTDLTAYDGTSAINLAISNYDSFSTVIVGLSPVTDWTTYISAGRAWADSVMYSSAAVTSLVDAFERQATPTFMRGLNRFTAGLADINSVMGSAFVIGMSNLERQFAQDVNDYRQKATLTLLKDRNLLIYQGANDMAKMQAQMIQGYQAKTQIYMDLMKLRIAAGVEQKTAQIDYEMRRLTWDMELFTHVSNIMAGITGAAVVPRPLSPMASLVSGALTGAATLAPIGAAVGGPEGAIIAAIVGLFGGGLAGILGA